MKTTNKDDQQNEMTYFTWDFSGEVAVGGEFETAGVLGSVVYNVNVPRLPTATDRETGKTCVMNQITFLSFLTCFYGLSISTESQRQVLFLTVKVGKHLRGAHLINPKLPHDNIVHRWSHFAPHIVVSARVELQVNVSFSEEKEDIQT